MSFRSNMLAAILIKGEERFWILVNEFFPFSLYNRIHKKEVSSSVSCYKQNKMLSYRRETALQGAL